MKPQNICIISAGELSGDQHAASMVRSLRALQPTFEFLGFGGECLQNVGVSLIGDYRQNGAVMGFGDVFKKLGSIYKAYQDMATAIRDLKPALLILVDYADFNMRLARVAHGLGVPVLFFIPPKVWAWRKNRIHSLKQFCSAIASIFPFETNYLKERGVTQVQFVGHPFCDEEIFRRDRQEVKLDLCRLLNLDPLRPVLSVFVGSRKKEIIRHIPPVTDALKLLLAQRPDTQVIFVKAKSIANLSLPSELSSAVVTDLDSRFVMMGSDAGIVKSGTSTLEAAFAELPFVCIYQAPKISEVLLRMFTSIESISLPNLICPGSVAELVQDDCNGPAICKETVELLEGPRRLKVLNSLKRVKVMLGESMNSYDKVAQIADALIQNKRI